MTIATAHSESEAQELAANDPEVKAGLLSVETHPAMFPALDGVKVEH